MSRVFLTVLDAVGAGELPDAADYGDVGTNTLGHVIAACDPKLPNMAAIGLGKITSTGYHWDGPVAGAYGRAAERSKGKDTTSGSVPQQAAAEAIPGLEKSNGSSGKSGLRVLESKNGESNVQQSREAAVQLIKENPDLKLIYTTNLPGTMGACQAIEELGKANDVMLVGFDCFDGAAAYIESGVLDAVVTQNPYNMGYLGVRYARKLLRGEAVAKQVDTGATLITADNLHDEDIQFLIDPAGNSGK